MTGIYWAITAGLLLGLFQLANRKAGKHIDFHRGNFLLLVAAFFVLLTGLIFTQDLNLLLTAPPSAWINFSLAGLVHFLGGWSLLTISQKKIGAARTGSLMGITPLFGALLAFMILGERLSIFAMAGIVLIVFGVYLVSNG